MIREKFLFIPGSKKLQFTEANAAEVLLSTRERLRWKQCHLAEYLGVAQATVNRWERKLGPCPVVRIYDAMKFLVEYADRHHAYGPEALRQMYQEVSGRAEDAQTVS
jgi:transcriptional regulator with XRE-family HTH domain